MAIESTLMLRREELRRRIRALPNEVQAWKKRTTDELDMNIHFSQLNAISTLIDLLRCLESAT